MGLITGILLNLPAQLKLSCPGGEEPFEEKMNEARNGYFALFGKKLPKGVVILKRPDDNAASEGIGFAGVILSAGIGSAGLIYSSKTDKASQQTFWELYQARKSYLLKSGGVMAWLIDKNGKKLNHDSASDGDQDWIAAELTALHKIKAGRWPLPAGLTLADLEKEVRRDLNAFWDAHIKEVNGKLIFLASDGGWAKRGDGREIYYPSYPDPAFIRLFAEFDKAHDWKKLADDVQALNQEVLNNYKKLGAVGQNPMPAKVFVSVASNGNFRIENYYTISKREGVKAADLKDNELDAIRFFLRMGRAAILNHDQKAVKMLAQIIAIAKITDPSSAYILAGEKGAPSKWGYNNTLARASYGLAVIGSGNNALAREFFCTVLRDHKGRFFGEWDGAKNYYYDQSLILQILDLVK